MFPHVFLSAGLMVNFIKTCRSNIDLAEDCHWGPKSFLSPPVQIARSAHMHHFLPVCLDLTKKWGK